MSISYLPDENTVKKLAPFKRFVLESFPWIDANFDAMTNYELMGKVIEYLNKTIESQNGVIDEFESIYNYFDNLDVQDEINQKLDEMATTGQLQSIINNYFSDVNEQIETLQADVNTQISVIDGKVSNIVSGAPAGVYDTVSALTTADPNHSKIYLVLADNKWYYYNTTTSTWTAGGQYLVASDSASLKHYGAMEVVPQTYFKITFTRSGNNFICTVPQNLYIFTEPNNVNNAFYQMTLTTTSYTIEPNQLLVCDLTNHNLQLVTQTQFRQNTNNYVLLAWNHYGYIKGQWYKYFVANIAEDANNLSLLTRHYGATEVVPPTYLKILFEKLQSGTIRIKVPERLLAFMEPGVATNGFYTISLAENERTYDVPSQNVLVLNLATNPYSLLVESQADFRTHIDSQVLLAWNHFGYIKGQWSKFVDNNQINNNKINITPLVDISSRQGSNGGYPENTLLGFEHAKSYGYNHVRVSFGWTLDGIPICCHNEYLYESTLRYTNGEEITDQTIKLSNMNYADIVANYDAGIYAGSEFAGIKVPKLEDVLLQCRRLGQKVDIEYKFGYSSTNLQNLLQLIYKYGMQEHVLFSTWYINIIEEIQASDYPLKIGMIRNLTSEYVNLAIQTGVDRLDIYDSDTYSADLVTLLHKNNIKVKVGSAYGLTQANTFINQYDVIECGVIENPLNY